MRHAEPYGQVFYVGKGHGNRVFHHVAAAVAADEAVSPKLDRIKAIHDAGLAVQHELLRFGLTDKTAFEVEAACIQLLGLDALLNTVHGHHVAEHGRMSVEAAISMFEAPPAPPITEPTLLIRIPQLWHPSMTPDQLAEATWGWWRLGPRREKARYALTISNGVIRAVYRIEPGSWRRQGPGDRGYDPQKPGRYPRWGFTGLPAPELDAFLNRHVRDRFKPGAQQPVMYVNC